jgi:hypothetical protein
MSNQRLADKIVPRQHPTAYPTNLESNYLIAAPASTGSVTPVT